MDYGDHIWYISYHITIVEKFTLGKLDTVDTVIHLELGDPVEINPNFFQSFQTLRVFVKYLPNAKPRWWP